MRKRASSISKGQSHASRRAKERGFTLVAMAVCSLALVAVIGLSIDLGRIFIAKTETQVYCDAAALAASTRLNGKISGIAAAQSVVAASANTWNLDSTTPANYTLEFATSGAGPWSSNPATTVGYNYARVRLPVQTPLFFLPIVANRYVQQVESISAAGQVPITTFGVGLAPYTVVSTNNNGPNFGLVEGQAYSIQWPQFNGTRSGCSNANPGRCFNSAPCSGDSDNSRWAVAHEWGSNSNGYWGFSANADIRNSVLNGLQTQAVSVGQNLLPIMSNGNKAVQAVVLDERTNQDADQVSATPVAYQGSTTHNGRRILLVPVVKPNNADVTEVLGFAAVLIYSNDAVSSNYYRNTTNGNDPFCAVYMGPYVIGSPNAGGATSGTGAYRARLVL